MYKSATDPLETITSGEEIILLKKTGVARETTVVRTDGPGVAQVFNTYGSATNPF